MKTFHEIYMPTNLALKKAMQDFRQQAGDMKMIASQHGKIIREDLMEYFMTKLEELPVGLDLKHESRLVIENYIKAFNAILDTLEKDLDSTIAPNLLKSFKSNGTFPNSLVTKNNRIYTLQIGVDDALSLFLNELCSLLNDEQKATVKPIIVNCLADWNITTENPCPVSLKPSNKKVLKKTFLRMVPSHETVTKTSP